MKENKSLSSILNETVLKYSKSYLMYYLADFQFKKEASKYAK